MAAYSIPQLHYSDVSLLCNSNNDLSLPGELYCHGHQLHSMSLPLVMDNNAVILQPDESSGIRNADALIFPEAISMGPPLPAFNFHHFVHQTTFLNPDAHHHQPTALDSWNVQAGRDKMEEAAASNLKVGRYSVEERKDRILRYLKKRNQRNFTKTIKYACRKTLADRRVRVRGRFARNMELSDEDQMRSINKEEYDCSDHSLVMTNNMTSIRMKQKQQQQQDIDDEDEWFQEAVAIFINN